MNRQINKAREKLKAKYRQAIEPHIRAQRHLTRAQQDQVLDRMAEEGTEPLATQKPVDPTFLFAVGEE